jgi:hypothetical protein
MPFVAAKITPLGDVSIPTISYAAFAVLRTGRQVMSAPISLEPVDAAYVTILVDNFVDALLPGSEVAQRPRVAYDM